MINILCIMYYVLCIICIVLRGYGTVLNDTKYIIISCFLFPNTL